MEPRTKLQARVFALSQSISKITEDQKKWAFQNCLRHIGYRTKISISCLDCGNVWPGPQKVKSCECPKCGVKLKIEDTRKKNLDQGRSIMALMDVVDDFQVNRFFEISSFHKSGEAPRQYVKEIVQQWFIPDGKLTIVAMTDYFGNGSFSGSMEIRANISNYWSSNKYDIYTDKIYPKANLLRLYKRNGFTTNIEGVQLYSFLKDLARDSKTETLLKAKQFSLLKAIRGDNGSLVHRYWNSIKICIRNKYIVKDSSSYLDYLDMLRDAGKDLRSPKYVCPSNFKSEHNRLVAKRAKALRIQRLERERLQLEKQKITTEQERLNYIQEKGPYFGLVFTDGGITIKLLESIEEFIAEGEHHKHCVYTNRYYNRQDSLCFSASIDGNPVETIEVSLKEMKVIQARGFHNHASKFHEQIIELMKQNMHMIRKRHREVHKIKAMVNVKQMEAA